MQNVELLCRDGWRATLTTDTLYADGEPVLHIESKSGVCPHCGKEQEATSEYFLPWSKCEFNGGKGTASGLVKEAITTKYFTEDELKMAWRFLERTCSFSFWLDLLYASDAWQDNQKKRLADRLDKDDKDFPL